MKFGEVISDTPIVRTTVSDSSNPLPPSAGPDFREWAAYECYVRDVVKSGQTPWRWGVLREDLKEEWRAFADKLVAEWTADEAAAKARREQYDIPNTERSGASSAPVSGSEAVRVSDSRRPD